jgi:hypothetical protein
VWKLIINPRINGQTLPEKDRKVFLVNLENDPAEQINLADSFPHIVEELRQYKP